MLDIHMKGSTVLPIEGVRSILIRGANWIGDAVMTLPAVAALRSTFPQARISMLVKPWVAEVFNLCNDVDEVIPFRSPGVHAGLTGKYRLAMELRQRKFDVAILLQNAIEAAIIARLAGIPVRAGYNTDGRGFLLTHSVRRTQAVRKVHQIQYYLEMVGALGCRASGVEFHLQPGRDGEAVSAKLLSELGVGKDDFLIGLAPGATYGPAKKWFPERFAAVADRLMGDLSARGIVFGSGEDRKSADLVQKHATRPLINVAGKTNLREAIALIARCGLFLSNDSGLMHVAGALNVPTVAIFGSTNPTATSPPGERSLVIYKSASCSPCLKETCPTDFRCMEEIGVDEVYEAARGLLAR